MAGKIAVLYSSTYGHVRTLAVAIAEAARATGATVDIYRFPEVLSEEIRQKMHAAPHDEAHKEITPDLLKDYDGFLIGSATRYGRVTASASAFFDATGGLWATGALHGKFAGIFTSSASQHGGQETTALTTIPFLAHHGVAFVPIGFAASQLTDNSEIVGGSAYGAAAIANGDGSRAVSEKELEIAAFQGKTFATLINTFAAGKAKLAATPATEAAHAKTAPTEPAAVTEAMEVNPNTVKPYDVDGKAAETPAPTTTAAASTTEEAPKAEAAAPAPAEANAAAAPAAKKTEADDARGKGCCTIA